MRGKTESDVNANEDTHERKTRYLCAFFRRKRTFCPFLALKSSIMDPVFCGGSKGRKFTNIQSLLLLIQLIMFLIFYSEIFPPADSLYKESKQVQTLSNHSRCFKD